MVFNVLRRTARITATVGEVFADARPTVDMTTTQHR